MDTLQICIIAGFLFGIVSGILVETIFPRAKKPLFIILGICRLAVAFTNVALATTLMPIRIYLANVALASLGSGLVILGIYLR